MMNDESPFAPAPIQDDQDQRASITTNAPDDVFAIKNETPPAFDWKPLIKDDMDRQARMAARAPDDSFVMNDGIAPSDWGPLIREDLYQRARMASGALDLSYRYVNADEAATARRIAQQTGITYGEALRNPVEADLMHRRQVFGQFADAHPEQADWIVDNADLIHDDIDAIDAIITSAKKILPFFSGEDGKQIIATLAGPLLPGGAVLGRPAMQGAVGDFLGSSIHGLGETFDVGIRSAGRAFDLPDQYDLSAYPDMTGFLVMQTPLGGACGTTSKRWSRRKAIRFCLWARG